MANFTFVGLGILIYIAISAGVIYALVPRKLLSPRHLYTPKQLQELLKLRNDSIEIGIKLCAAVGLYSLRRIKTSNLGSFRATCCPNLLGNLREMKNTLTNL
jgi:hypothetical protein